MDSKVLNWDETWAAIGHYDRNMLELERRTLDLDERTGKGEYSTLLMARSRTWATKGFVPCSRFVGRQEKNQKIFSVDIPKLVRRDGDLVLIMNADQSY